MKLSRILSALDRELLPGRTGPAGADPEILDLTEDSRAVREGSLFFARAGQKTSGLRFVREAVSRGARAVISDEEIPGLTVPAARVASMSRAQSAAADFFYGHPSGRLRVVGVTGTNGKTTFTYLLEAVAVEAGWRTGVIGTVNYRLPIQGGTGVETIAAPNTTPNALVLQRALHEMRGRGADLAVLEVSSHALELDRADRVDFDGAVFTNLTQDHLDFHKDMEGYFAAKSKLFSRMTSEPKAIPGSKGRPGKFCIINMDDAYGKKMADACAVRPTGYGIDSQAEITAKNLRLESRESRFDLRLLDGAGRALPAAQAVIRLPGRHNVQNALAAAGAAGLLGIPLPVILKGLARLESVPGRLEPIDCGQDFTVVVDYAHTEDALRNVLKAVRHLAGKRVLTLFGCGGDRDRSKRPLMGAAATELSDFCVITSDNPRSEDPSRIALDVEVGIHRAGRKNYEIVIDRKEAIARILQMARPGDWVLLAGKGHETVQIFADKRVQFDDREIARQFLSGRA